MRHNDEDLLGNTNILFSNNIKGSIFPDNRPGTAGLYVKELSDTDKLKIAGLISSSGMRSTGGSIFNFRSYIGNK